MLDDIDWRAGTIVVRGKGNCIERVPLPQDVGLRLVEYLEQARPMNALGRAVFVTVNDVMALMVNGRQIDPDERGRVRSSIAQSMVTLHDRGELVKEQEHFGRRQTIWRKAQLNGHRNGVGTRG